jgi:hypothetical protein
VLIGKIVYGKVSSGNSKGEKNNQGCPSAYRIVCVIPPPVKVTWILVLHPIKLNAIFIALQ